MVDRSIAEMVQRGSDRVQKRFKGSETVQWFKDGSMVQRWFKVQKSGFKAFAKFKEALEAS
jgi:hypothetical protein